MNDTEKLHLAIGYLKGLISGHDYCFSADVKAIKNFIAELENTVDKTEMV